VVNFDWKKSERVGGRRNRPRTGLPPPPLNHRLLLRRGGAARSRTPSDAGLTERRPGRDAVVLLIGWLRGAASLADAEGPGGKASCGRRGLAEGAGTYTPLPDVGGLVGGAAGLGPAEAQLVIGRRAFPAALAIGGWPGARR